MEAINGGGGNVARRDTGLSRVPTQYETDYDLERHPTALSRIHTQRSQHTATVGGGVSRVNTGGGGGIGIFRTRSSKASRPLPAFGAGKPYPPPLPEREEYVVEFDGPTDPMHPQNWSMKKRVIIGATLGYVTLTAAFGSSIFSAATASVAREFGVSSEVGILGVSLYVSRETHEVKCFTLPLLTLLRFWVLRLVRSCGPPSQSCTVDVHLFSSAPSHSPSSASQSLWARTCRPS